MGLEPAVEWVTMSEQRDRGLCAVAVFLALFAIFLLTAPGRIDSVDGQWRYDVAQNWLSGRGPVVTDPYLLASGEQLVNSRTRKSYSFYDAAPSITPLPFMLLSRLLPGHSAERDCFAFTLAGPCFGALLGALLLVAYGWLGIALRPSLIYTSLFCLATLWWPGSVTIFDQNQHAVLLLASVLLAWQSGRRNSTRLAALAGFLGGLLLSYQEMYALLLPVAGLAVLSSPEEGSSENAATLQRFPDRAALGRYLAFGLGCSGGLALFFAFNEIRFGTPLVLDKYGSHNGLMPPTWGNPLAGFLSLAISPGKGIFWFSPPLLLACLGARRLFRRAPALAVTVAGVSIIDLLVISHLRFFSGDRCWGPRYALLLMPLWALALPFARLRRNEERGMRNEKKFRPTFLVPRSLFLVVSAAGLLIQIMGVSLEHQRFFYERNLSGFFWATAPWFYFHDSQLIARPFEIAQSLRTGVPREARQFSTTPDRVTYFLYNPDDARLSRRWMRQLQVFYLPRPWWGWMGRIRAEQQPVNPFWMMTGCAVLLMLGGTLLARALHAGSFHAEARSAGVDPAENQPVEDRDLAAEACR
jgi:hypothetical protein